jgi:hypothetical protein
MRRTTITTVVIGLAVIAPATAAEARERVTHAAAFASAQRLADQSATGLEDLGNGAIRVDRSRTSVGNYMNYGKFRKGVSFALFGTNTVDGQTRTLWCIGNFVFAAGKNGRTTRTGNVSCAAS